MLTQDLNKLKAEKDKLESFIKVDKILLQSTLA